MMTLDPSNFQPRRLENSGDVSHQQVPVNDLIVRFTGLLNAKVV